MLICDYCEEKITEEDQIGCVHGTIVTCAGCLKIMENNGKAFDTLRIAIHKIVFENNKDEEWITESINDILSDIRK